MILGSLLSFYLPVKVCLLIFRVTIKSDLSPESVVLGELHIAGAESGDSGAYFCQASNLYGRDQQLVQLTVQGMFSMYFFLIL